MSKFGGVSLAGHAWAATPEGIAQEIREALAKMPPEHRVTIVGRALFVAAGIEPVYIERRRTQMTKVQEQRIGRAIDVLTGNGLPVMEQGNRPTASNVKRSKCG